MIRVVDPDFIDRMVVSHFRPDCPACGANDWRIFGKAIDGNPTRLVLGATWPDGNPVEDFGLAVFAHACNKCRHVRLTVADPIVTLGEEPEGDPDPDSHE
jgi:hypothetical protein